MPDATITATTSIDTSGLKSGTDEMVSATQAGLNQIKAEYKAAGNAIKFASEEGMALLRQFAEDGIAVNAEALAGYQAAANSAQQQTVALGFAAAATASPVTALGTAAGNAATPTAGLGGAAGGAVPPVVALGGAASAAAGPVTSLGSASAGAAQGMFQLYGAISIVRRGLEALDKFREAEENLDHLAEATGVTAERLAEFEGAVELAGGKGTEFGQVVNRLARAMETASQGSAKMQDDLRRLGVTAKDPIEAFYQIAGTVHDTRDRFEALGVASQVLGRNAADLVGIFAEGSGALRDNAAASKEVAEARVAAIQSARDMTKSEGELKQALTTIAAESFPAVTYALKVVVVAFDAALFPVKALFTTIIDSSVAAIGIVGSLGDVVGDVFSRNFAKASVDAKAGFAGLKLDLQHLMEDLKKDADEAPAFAAKIFAPAPGVTPGAGKPFPGPDKSKQEAAAQRKLQEELKSGYDAMLADLKADHEVTKAEELGFRENELEEVSQWGLKTNKLKGELAKEIGALQQAVFREQDAAAKRNRAEQLSEENRQFELQIRAIEEHSREVAAAGKRAAEEQKRAVEVARATEGASSAGTLTGLSIDKDELALQQQGGLFAKSTAEQVAYLEQVRAIDQQIETEKLRHVLRDIQIDAVNGDTKKLEDDQRQLAVVQRQVHLQMERDTAAVLNKQQQDYKQFFNTVNQGFVSAFGQWLNGHRSFVAGLQQLWTQMVTHFANVLIQMGLKWVEQQAMMTITHAASQQAQVAATATAAAQKKAINATTTLTEINANAVKAATGAYAATVDIPIIGPVLAPVAAGVAYAGVIALGALAAFESGGIVPNTGVALVHQGEAVLPQPLTQMLTSAAGQGGGGVTVNGGVHIHSPSSDPKQHAVDFMGQLRRMNLRMA